VNQGLGGADNRIEFAAALVRTLSLSIMEPRITVINSITSGVDHYDFNKDFKFCFNRVGGLYENDSEYSFPMHLKLHITDIE
jgi:hypothetical protein